MEGSQATGTACDRVADVRQKLGAPDSYDDILPVTLTSHAPALLTYYVELVNHAQKSAGRSNAAYAAEGPAPAAMQGVTATLRAEGVVLHWDAAQSGGCTDCDIRIDRMLQGTSSKAQQAASRPARLSPNPFATPPPPTRQLLEVSTAAMHEDSSREERNEAIDRSIQVGEKYEYRLRRVETISLDGHTLELLGEESTPVTIQTRDIFPPAVPQDLAAVADDGTRAIDLSWSPDIEPDLSGYVVYRREVKDDSGPRRISGATPLPTPTYHDTEVQPGIRYAYSVTAVDQAGNESARSNEAEETLSPPQQ